jgi:CRP-like cAMP-binding protein
MGASELFQSDKFDLNSSKIIKDLPVADLEILLKNKSSHLYRKGQVVFRENSYPTGIYLVESGLAKKIKLDAAENEHIVYICTAGDIMGFQSVLSAGRYLDSAIALEDSNIAFIPREDFLAAVEQSAVLASRLLRILSHEFGVMLHALTVQNRRTVRERLAITLVNLVEKINKQHPESDSRPIISLSRTDLAQMCGTTKETVVRVLAEFKASKTVATSGSKIYIDDLAALVKIAALG